MSIIKDYLEKQQQAEQKRQTQLQRAHRTALLFSDGLATELSHIFSAFPSIVGLTTNHEGFLLTPYEYHFNIDRNQLLIVLQWSKSSIGPFYYTRLCNILNTLCNYLIRYRMKILHHMSHANQTIMKKRYFFLLRGIQLVKLQEDAFNIYLYVETRLH